MGEHDVDDGADDAAAVELLADYLPLLPRRSTFPDSRLPLNPWCLFDPGSQVSLAPRGTSDPQPAPSAHTTAKRESSSSAVSLRAPSSGRSESTRSGLGEGTSSTVLCVLKVAILPGPRSMLPARLGSSVLYVDVCWVWGDWSFDCFIGIGVQCLEQRACEDKHPCEERHHPDRCYSLPPVVRSPRTSISSHFSFSRSSLIHLPSSTQYAQPVSKKAAKSTTATTEATEPAEEKKPLSHHAQRSLDNKKKDAKIDPLLDGQFAAGRLYAAISSRPGQSGRADGYVLEGKELEVSLRSVLCHYALKSNLTFCVMQFYLRKLRSGKQKHAA